MKNIKYIAGALLGSLLLTGCADNPMTAVYNNNERIASSSNSYNLDHVEQELSDGQIQASVERLEGMETVWTYASDTDQEVPISYSMNVYSGKLKIVLITPDGEVDIIEECTANASASAEGTLNVQNGNNRIKLVADKDTKFDIEISIEEGDFSKIG